MCAGCVQSGLEFGSSNALLLASGIRHSGRRILDRLRPSGGGPAARRAQREIEAAAFLEALDLDAAAILGWPAPEVPEPVQIGALQLA